MKLGRGRMPLRVKLAFLLAVTLLLPGVTPMSIERATEPTALLSPSVTPTSVERSTETTDLLTPSAANGAKSNEPEKDSNEVGVLDDSMEYDDNEETVETQQDAGREETNAETNLQESPKDNNGLDANAAEDENLAGLDESYEAESEVDPLDLIRRIVKRAVEGDDEADESEPETINVDDFSFSDLPKLFEPLIQAFSGREGSEAPTPEDVFSWFPGLMKLLEPNKGEPSAAYPSGLPGSSVTHTARRSGSPTSPKLSLQIAPASSSAQPAESEALPSPPSLLEELVTPVPPTLPAPTQTSEPSLPDVPDSEEMFH